VDFVQSQALILPTYFVEDEIRIGQHALDIGLDPLESGGRALGFLFGDIATQEA